LKFAICNETFGDWDWSKAFELARSIGYTGLEVAPFTLGANATSIPSQARRDYARLAQDHGLRIIGLHWLLAKTEGFHLTTADVTVRQRTTEYFHRLVELCADLGGEVMVLGSPLQRNFPSTMTHDEAMKNAVETLQPVIPILESHRVRIALEPLGPVEGNFLNHAYQAREMIALLGSPMIQLHLDVKAMSSEGPPIEQIIRDHRDLMIHFHANDPNRLGPGMGDVDQRPIFAALKEVDYVGWVSVEVFDYSPGVENILRQSWDNMQRAMA
jgi:sugar phosphate isomerase/epimerase